MNRRDLALALFPLALMASFPAQGEQLADGAVPPTLDATQKRVVIETLATTLQRHYVFPEVGMRYAARLRAQLASGAYDDLTDAAAFAARVTGDLRAVSPDRHLTLGLSKRPSRRGPDPVDAPASTKASGPRGLEEARMIGDVAYLRFNEFPGDASASNARTFLLAHADARAVIIDSRPNRGGRLDEMNAILPLLVSQPTRLYRMEMRADAVPPFQGTPMIQAVPGVASLQSWDHTIIPDATERRLQVVPIYYLISRRTASAAEALGLGFKSSGRATLVGETTAGAGYFGGFFPVGDPALQAWISTGRTYDPKTNWDWEGKGIAPDVVVPVDDALTVALDLIGQYGKPEYNL